VTYKAIDIFGSPGTPNGAFYASPNNTLNAFGGSATVDWKIGDGLALKSITAYRHYVSQFGDDNSDSPIPLVLEEARFTHRQFSQELRLNGSVRRFLDYTVGGIYFDQKTFYASREDDPFVPFGTPTQPTFDFMQNDPAEVKTHAAFLNTTWHLTSALSVIAGVRYTKENKSYTFERLNIDGVTPYLPLGNPNNTMAFGGPLHPLRLPVTAAGPDEVLVRVAAAAVNPADLGMVAGRYRWHDEVRFPLVPGYDVAGTIEATGQPVVAFTRHKSTQRGGYALGAQAGEAAIRQVVLDAGFTRFRRAAETPFNLVFEARP